MMLSIKKVFVISILLVLTIALALIGSNIGNNNNDKLCLRNQTNTQWIDACCVKSRTIEMNETYEVSASLLIDEQSDLFIKIQMGKNATSTPNITSSQSILSPAFCIDGLNTSELNGIIIDGRRIDAEKCSQTPKEITVTVKCREVLHESPSS